MVFTIALGIVLAVIILAILIYGGAFMISVIEEIKDRITHPIPKEVNDAVEKALRENNAITPGYLKSLKEQGAKKSKSK
ncbi:MAG: hypothetical protein M1400_01615 [Patescibacteria group bacterium]|nr:hypothetical protein [Patescibacteria group bacterium]